MSTNPDDRLHAYLEDHLAGSVAAVALLEDARKRWADEAAGAFFGALLAEVEEDQAVLEGVLDRVGAAPSRLKNAGAAAAEKVTALRQRLSDERLGLVETLESLLLGVRGKRGLWTVLGDVARADGRLAGVDFAALGRRADDQLARIERHRVAAARAAFLDEGGP